MSGWRCFMTLMSYGRINERVTVPAFCLQVAELLTAESHYLRQGRLASCMTMSPSSSPRPLRLFPCLSDGLRASAPAARRCAAGSSRSRGSSLASAPTIVIRTLSRIKCSFIFHPEQPHADLHFRRRKSGLTVLRSRGSAARTPASECRLLSLLNNTFNSTPTHRALSHSSTAATARSPRRPLRCSWP